MNLNFLKAHIKVGFYNIYIYIYIYSDTMGLTNIEIYNFFKTLIKLKYLSTKLTPLLSAPLSLNPNSALNRKERVN